jgi:hypothetical protein
MQARGYDVVLCDDRRATAISRSSDVEALWMGSQRRPGGAKAFDRKQKTV